jgi:prevent-host-death family protein
MAMKALSQPETLTIPAGEFKAKCLGIIDDVYHGSAEVLITKRGKPVARLVPVATEDRPFRSVFGRTPAVRIPTDSEWREFKIEMAKDWEQSTEGLIRQLDAPAGKGRKR